MTLRLQSMPGKTLLSALLLIPLMIGLLEGIFRLTPVQALLAPPGIGTNEEFTAIKLHKLDALAQTEQIDCIIMGSSMSFWGFEPESLSAAFEQATGESLTCFNFAAFGVATGDLDLLSEYLVRTYHPRLLILGTSARDFSATTGSEVLGLRIEVPYLRYQLGEFSLEGWLTNWSQSYRYYQTYRLWTVPDYHEWLDRLRNYDHTMSAFGYLPNNGVMDVSNSSSEIDPLIQAALSNYEVSPQHVDGLRNILALQQQYSVRVVAVEMPLTTVYLSLFGDDQAGYVIFQEMLAEKTVAHDIYLVPSVSADEIPADGWADHGHLNTKGGIVFSKWLGQQLGHAIKSGSLSLSVP